MLGANHLRNRCFEKRFPIRRQFRYTGSDRTHVVADVDQRLQRADIGGAVIRESGDRRNRRRIAARGGAPQCEVCMARGEARPDGVVQQTFGIRRNHGGQDGA